MDMEIEISGHTVLLDDCDAELATSYKWLVHTKPTKHRDYKYVVHYRQVDGKSKVFRLHRLITNAPDGFCVDHINGNGLDNRRANLRVCSHEENSRNRRVGANNTSGFKGVYYDSRRNKWVARIGLSGKKRRLGSFDSPEKAHAAYVAAARVLHGAFARAA